MRNIICFISAILLLGAAQNAKAAMVALNYSGTIDDVLDVQAFAGNPDGSYYPELQSIAQSLLDLDGASFTARYLFDSEAGATIDEQRTFFSIVFDTGLTFSGTTGASVEFFDNSGGSDVIFIQNDSYQGNAKVNDTNYISYIFEEDVLIVNPDDTFSSTDDLYSLSLFKDEIFHSSFFYRGAVFADQNFRELTNFTLEGSISEYSISAVPLPAGVWLFGTALAGLGLVARKRKQAS